MKRPLRLAFGLLAVAAIGHLTSAPSRGQPPEGPDFPFPPGMNRPDPLLMEFQQIAKTAKTQDGLFKLYQKDDKVYAELLPHHFNKHLLVPIAIAKGAGAGGSTLNFEEQWVVYFKRIGNQVHLIRRNVHYKAKSGSPTARAVDITYTDSVLQSLRIAGMNMQTQGVLINLNDIFMSDFGELGLGRFDPSRSVWHKVKAFPKNLELQVQATYTGGWRAPDGVIDSRGTTVVVHYGLVELPDGGYTPRVADDRVGHFVTAVKDFSSTSKDTAFVRYVNRWRLEPSEPIVPGKLVVPKRSIKFYVEKTVPHEYRAAVVDGILEWNKAFEKIGFRNAIEVVQQRDDEEFDPEDMNFNTFRWITTDQAFAMGPSRANPVTGEILDADIIFDADLVRMWKQERTLQGVDGKAFEPVSPVQALEMGATVRDFRANAAGWNDRPQQLTGEEARLAAIRRGACDCRGCLKMQLSLGALALASLDAQEPKNPKDGPKDKDGKQPKEKDGKAKARDAELELMINQAIKYVVMHEVGHTLGLRHNFKGSTMLPAAKLHDKEVTGKNGMVGSVMDYLPINLAPKGAKQGDYFPTTIGPYDYWAIEYAYQPTATDDELKKIASRGSSTPGLDYGTDEDTFLSADPNVNLFDLGEDVLGFAKGRMLAAEDLLKTVSARAIEDGEGHQRVRVAFTLLLAQYADSAYLMSKYVGGEHANRDHRSDPKGRDPLVPVDPAKQREALKFLQDHVFTDRPFDFPPELLRKLAVERWMHWGSDFASTDFPIHDRVLGIQKLALNQLLSARSLQRVQSNALKCEKGAKPVTLAEVFRCTTDSVWANVPVAPKKDKELTSSILQRNLQREHLKKLSALVLGEKPSNSSFLFGAEMFETRGAAVPPDARSLARYHLREIGRRIDTALANHVANGDETVAAHLEECKERIAKVLSAPMQAND
jgi:hypothetical protein